MIPKSFDSISNLFSTRWIEFLLLFLAIVFFLVEFVKHKYSYWERRKIFAAKASIPFGCFTDLLLGRRHIFEIVQDVYKKGEGHKYIGYYSFWTPTLLVRDPELIKIIMIKDFDHFCNRGMYYNDKEDPLSAHLFALEGTKWKKTRNILNSAFSTGKIKQMYETMKVCSIQLRKHLIDKINRNEEIEFKELFSRHSVNVIANAALGVERHTLENESKLTDVAYIITAPSVIQNLRFVLALLSKTIARLLNMRFTPKEVERYCLDLTKETVEKRTKSTVQHNDYFQLLIKSWDGNLSFDRHENSENSNSLTLRDVAAQAFLFILAAFETTTATLYFTLYELAKNPDVQEKLFEEIDQLGETEDVTYNQLMDLKYLDMVFYETLRKYPGSGVLFRECQKPYKLPNGEILEKGVNVTIPHHALHHDPEYFPNPDKFDPERFNKSNPIHPILPFTYLTFGEGPRNCIGRRYGIVNTKIALFTLLSNFRFELTEKSPNPLVIDPKIFVMQSAGGMYLKAIIRK